MKGRQIPYSANELAWIKARAKRNRRETHAAFCEQFGRPDVSLKNFNALCKRNGWFTGRTGHFVKGQEPANKGKKMPPGVGGNHPNARRTQFKKGQLPHNTKYLGHERLTVDGYVEISVDEVNPHTGYERRYVQKHRWLWEQKNGPVPEGHALKCLDGNKQNTDPSNWEAIPRALLPLLNGGRASIMHYDAAPAELKPAILATAKLKHAVKRKPATPAAPLKQQ